MMFTKENTEHLNHTKEVTQKISSYYKWKKDCNYKKIVKFTPNSKHRIIMIPQKK